MVAISTMPLVEQQHLVLTGVDWSFYEDVLAKAGNGALRVTYRDGSIEMMAPLPEHESAKECIGTLIDLMALELNMSVLRFGSTTFRREDQQMGLEPDKCYYFKNASRVAGMRRFDAAIFPPPDLAIEIDIASRSIPRQPIYAALGVPEIWRYDGAKLMVLLLNPDAKYVPSDRSPTFPMLPLEAFQAYVQRLERDPQAGVLREFRDWVRAFAVE